MKKFILLIVIGLQAITVNAQQASPAATDSFSKMTTGLSIALIVVLALLLYTLNQKGKLHKQNLQLRQRLNELEKK